MRLKTIGSQTWVSSHVVGCRDAVIKWVKLVGTRGCTPMRLKAIGLQAWVSSHVVGCWDAIKCAKPAGVFSLY